MDNIKILKFFGLCFWDKLIYYRVLVKKFVFFLMGYRFIMVRGGCMDYNL